MEEILAQQRNAGKPLNGQSFVLALAGMIAMLAASQMIVTLLIAWTDIPALNALYYLAWIAVIARFVYRNVAGSIYTLKRGSLLLEKTLGDSTVYAVEIPCEAILGIRLSLAGDRLKSSYRSVRVMDHTAAIPLRVRIAFGFSVFVAAWARKIAGEAIYRRIGYVVAFHDGKKRVAVVFKPDDEFSAALRAELPHVWRVDERTKEDTHRSALGYSLQRTFPELYPFMNPLVDPQEAAEARAELERRKQRKKEKKARKARSKERMRQAKEKNKAAKKEENDEV